MIADEIRTFEYPNGDLQRVQLVRFGGLDELDFLLPSYGEKAFERIAELYSRFIVPSKPAIFGQLVLFHLPEDIAFPLPRDTGRFGSVTDNITAAAAVLRRGVRVIDGKPFFLKQEARLLWQRLERQDCIRIVRGRLPATTVLPVGNSLGFLSENEKTAGLKVNSSFFIMDRFDCATPYDTIGNPVGLMVKDGHVLNPPMYLRESLLCRRDGSVSIEVTDLRRLQISISGKRYLHGENCTVYTRPESRKTPLQSGTDLVVIGRRIAAVKKGGGTPVPSSGFVMNVKTEVPEPLENSVGYSGMEDIAFGIQVGNSILVDGKKTESFLSPFYNIRRLWSTSFPPSLYPLDFERARAPRIALGTDREGKAMLVWAEGRGKFPDPSYRESCGASLKEMAELCQTLGMYNAVNLDGGGSAQILLGNSRFLKVSDRNASDFSEAERAVPAGLIIR